MWECGKGGGVEGVEEFPRRTSRGSGNGLEMERLQVVEFD